MVMLRKSGQAALVNSAVLGGVWLAQVEAARRAKPAAHGRMLAARCS